MRIVKEFYDKVREEREKNQISEELNQINEKDKLNFDTFDEDDLICDPSYSYLPYNIFYEE